MKTTKTVLPALSENAFLRYFNFIALYFAQGVPEGMLFFGIPAWMAMNGKSAGEIASFGLHVDSAIEVGKISYRPAGFLAGAPYFK